MQNIQRQSPSQVQRRAFAIYKWGIVAPFLALSTFVLGSTICVFSLFGMPNFASDVFGTLWARLNMAVSFMGIEVEGLDKIEKGQSYVVVANHQSLVDIYVLYGYLGIGIKWVMKKELRAIPVLGIACEMMGHVIIDRSNTEAAVRSINDARDRIKNGVSIVFFPEGTRSRTGQLKPFKKGAFRLAQELGLPILPVTIHDTRYILPSDTTDLFPGKVKLQINDPIPAGAPGETDANALSSRARQAIAETLELEETA